MRPYANDAFHDFSVMSPELFLSGFRLLCHNSNISLPWNLQLRIIAVAHSEYLVLQYVHVTKCNLSYGPIINTYKFSHTLTEKLTVAERNHLHQKLRLWACPTMPTGRLLADF